VGIQISGFPTDRSSGHPSVQQRRQPGGPTGRHGTARGDLLQRAFRGLSGREESDQIASVVIIRSDHNTHSLDTGSRYVRLAFHPKDEIREGELRVNAPRLPAQAITGIYMLFVVDKAGVPSVGRQLRLNEEDNEDNENRRGRLE